MKVTSGIINAVMKIGLNDAATEFYETKSITTIGKLMYETYLMCSLGNENDALNYIEEMKDDIQETYAMISSINDDEFPSILLELISVIINTIDDSEVGAGNEFKNSDLANDVMLITSTIDSETWFIKDSSDLSNPLQKCIYDVYYAVKENKGDDQLKTVIAMNMLQIMQNVFSYVYLEDVEIQTIIMDNDSISERFAAYCQIIMDMAGEEDDLIMAGTEAVILGMVSLMHSFANNMLSEKRSDEENDTDEAVDVPDAFSSFIDEIDFDI